MSLLRDGLLGTAPGKRTSAALATLTPEDWAWIFQQSRQQTVTGLINRAVSQMDDSVPIPDSILFSFMAESDRIAEAARRHTRVAHDLEAVFVDAGLHPVFMKGHMVARLYSPSDIRESGDIDIFFNRTEFDAARAVAEKVGQDIHKSPDGSLRYVFEGVGIDQHDRYFDLHCADADLPAPISAEGELLMLSAHILKHACRAGVGLRQLCDMTMAYRGLEYNPESLQRVYKRCGLLRWNQLLSAFLNQYLGADAPLFGAGPGLPTRTLYNLIFAGGNFGHYAPSRRRALDRSAFSRKADTFSRILKRLPFALRYAPRESWHSFKELVRGNLEN